MSLFREVKVWEKSHKVGLHVYRATVDFPKGEQYGLTQQIRRVAASLPAKIAEGCGRGNNRDLPRFLESARGSASELEYQILLARELDYLSEPEYQSLHEELKEVQKMLSGFLKTLRTRAAPKRSPSARE